MVVSIGMNLAFRYTFISPTATSEAAEHVRWETVPANQNRGMIKPGQHGNILKTLILKILPWQTEHRFFFNLCTMKTKTRSTIMKTANATLRQYTRRMESLVEPPNMQSREEIHQIPFHIQKFIHDFFKMEKTMLCNISCHHIPAILISVPFPKTISPQEDRAQ